MKSLKLKLNYETIATMILIIGERNKILNELAKFRSHFAATEKQEKYFINVENLYKIKSKILCCHYFWHNGTICCYESSRIKEMIIIIKLTFVATVEGF